VRIDEFKQKLAKALGSSMENATPANVRDFVDQIQVELWREEYPHHTTSDGAYRIDTHERVDVSYETLMRRFFVKALSADKEQALIQLWILSLDLAYGGIEEMHSEQMNQLFTVDAEDSSGL
jgi:hypothetical protein